MKKSTFKSIVVLSFSLFCFGVYAQSSAKIWTSVSERATESKVKEYRNSIPADYKLYSLNTAAMLSALNNAPSRANIKNSNTIIELPVANGEIQRFRVVDAPTLAPELQQIHPNIRSFAGQGIDDPSAVARFSTSPNGVNVMISSANNKTFYIDPYTKDKQAYIAYSRKDLPAPLEPFVCLVEEEIGPRASDADVQTATRNADDGILRTFRLALACNGEYSVFHLNNQGIPASATDAVKKAAILGAMNVAMTRVNGIYERDLAVTMVIIPNNEDIIFLNTATDGLSNDSGMINQIQPIIDGAIGSANYDIGHVFSTGGGGIAQLNSPCTNGKARGVTGLPQPIGDPFYVDYVAHEMGHQYGGNHTQNNNCQRSSASYEPGSASTIMGYAGICPPNVQNASDDYFHAISIFEMFRNITIGNSQCAAQSNTNNLPPEADAGDSFTIPGGTPFILSGVATDPDSDQGSLTHCWEQFDNATGIMPPRPTSTQGPAFRTIDPLASPERYMPNLNTILNSRDDDGNVNNDNRNTWEVPAEVTRFMRFRYTVRDNAPGGAATASDNMVVNFDGNSGPFIITSQSATTPPQNYEWTTRGTETITWNVANSDQAPVSCTNVDIMFSPDRGLTWSTILANTPNDGSEDITVPIVNTTQGRIMVKAVGNIFMDINNRDITVSGSLATEDFAFDNFSVYPNPTSGFVNVTFTPLSTDNVEISLFDQRGRLINKTSFDNVSGTFNKQLQYGNIDTGVYFMVIKNAGKTTTKKLVKQ